MSKTLPGAERLQRQDLRATIAATDAELHVHNQHCSRCHQAGSDVYAKCEVWWNLARKLHRARRRLDAFEHSPNPNQQALPGME